MKIELPTLYPTIKKAYDHMGALRGEHDKVLGSISERATFSAYGAGNEETLFTVGTDVPASTKLRLMGLSIYNGEAAEVVFQVYDNATQVYVPVPVAAGQMVVLGEEDALYGIEIATSLVIGATGAFAAGSDVFATVMPIVPGIVE